MIGRGALLLVVPTYLQSLSWWGLSNDRKLAKGNLTGFLMA